MANRTFFRTRHHFVTAGGLDTVDLRAALVMTNSTVFTDPDVTFLDDFTLLDECDAGAYARVDLASVALNVDVANDRLELASASADFGSLAIGPSGRDLAGVLLYAHLGGGTDAENRPLVALDQVASGPVFPFTLTGGPVQIVVPSDGWLWI